jgi:glycosidase
MSLRLFLTLVWTATLCIAEPVVSRIEPPSWWAGHTMNPVRLLVTGKGLTDAKVTLEGGGGRVSRVVVSPSGTHLFCDLDLSRSARPGVRRLRVATGKGNAEGSFEVLAPQVPKGRFQGFGPDDLIYLIMPDRFANGDPSNDSTTKSPDLVDRSKARHYHGGDLRGVIQRLPYLQSLGVTALWLNPWYDNNDALNQKEKYTRENRLDPKAGEAITDYHGYGATDFYAVDEHLGDLATLRELVDTAHRLGIRILQDQVANHVGPYHPWVQDPPTPTWFHGTAADHPENTWQTWTIPNPHATPDLRRTTLDGWFINLLPDLNQDDPECARYLIQNALWWVGITGIDGIRQDTLPYVPRTFWRDWSRDLKRQHPHLNLLGEVFDGDTLKVAFYQSGAARFDGVDSGIDTLFDFPLFYRVRDTFGEGRSIKGLAEQLARDWVYPDATRLVTFAGLHDVDRFMNVSGATREGLRLATVFLLTSRGIPLIYYGDEIGLPGGGDPDNRRDFPGGFPGDARNVFEISGRTPEEQRLWTDIQTVARFRKQSLALRRGALIQLVVEDQIYAYARQTGAEIVVVVFNNATTPQSVTVPMGSLRLPSQAGWTAVLGEGPVEAKADQLTLSMSGRSVGVLRWTGVWEGKIHTQTGRR